MNNILLIICIALTVASCGPTRSPVNSKGHINEEVIQSIEEESIPDIVTEAPVVPPPRIRPKEETYTVVVNDVNVKELLFALARDAKLNIDIYSGITGNVTINAIDQTLPQILQRISDQVSIRYDLDDQHLIIQPDLPFIKTYNVDYVNISRDTASENIVATQIGSTGQGAQGAQGAQQSGGAGANNNSITRVSSVSINHFWENLSKNIFSILDKTSVAEDNKQFEGDNDLIINKESGLITVRATAKQHNEIQRYVDKVMNSAKRQVLIEATIAEVGLSDRYQSGIDWALISNDATANLSQNTIGTNLNTSPFFSFTFTDSGSSAGDITASVKMLETFGDVSVLSTPKVMTLNNQTAMLKVVDNRVYFSLDIDVDVSDNVINRTFQTNIHTVPVGIVMQVTPYINEDEEVILNVRPTISRIINYVDDPNPELANANVSSQIPEIQVREVETILKVRSGEVAVIGGLMQDTVDENESAVPFLSSIPLIGALFRYKDDTHAKTELVIFLRPKVIYRADINADLSDFKSHLPEINE